jgi:hypothetical protein
MFSQIDEKGKVFTKIIKKKKVPALIQTNLQRIEGNVYVSLDDRMIDELDHHQSFLPVTDAVIFDQKGKKIHEAEFLAIQISQIVWIMPVEGEMDGGKA